MGATKKLTAPRGMAPLVLALLATIGYACGQEEPRLTSPPAPEDNPTQRALKDMSAGEDPFADLDIISVLPVDAIPAVLQPKFVSVEQARGQYEFNELVLGLSINGDNRAYSIPYLSRREIVNDVVGGVPVAVTW